MGGGTCLGPAVHGPRRGSASRTGAVGVRVHTGCGTSRPLPVSAVEGHGPGLLDFGRVPHVAPHGLRGAGRCAAAADLLYSAPRGATRAGAITGAYVSAPPPFLQQCRPSPALGPDPARMMARRTLLWSLWAIQPPGGTSRFPPFRWRNTSSNERFLGYPEVAQFSHPSTFSTTWRVLLPTGSRMVSQSRTQASRAPSGRGTSLSPLPAPPGAPAPLGGWPSARFPPVATGRGGSVAAVGRLEEDQAPQGGVHVLDGRGLVVVRVVCRHPLDARADALHHLDLCPRAFSGLFAVQVVPLALPVPFCLWAPPALAVAPRVPSTPLPADTFPDAGPPP